MPTMAHFPTIDTISEVTLKSGFWVNENCMTFVNTLQHEGGCSFDLGIRRGPLAPVTDSPSILRTSQKLVVTTSSTNGCVKRGVSFASSVEVREAPHATSLTRDEIMASWWTPNDYMLIRKMFKITLQMILNGGHFMNDDKDFCARGLECRTKWGHLRHRNHKQRAVRAVLHSQEFQRYEGFRDSEYIAEIYGEYSRTSAKEAREIAEFVAREE